ncbi:gp53-like domain-containing protein [Escherichia coli]|uniref:gp53-like domain-containing protein n=1 Tax=Escherichia coli TaxID=562 RepID=UPI003AFAA8DA
MAKNDFKAFATDRNANVISQEEWEALPALISGFTAGKASSAQVNKVIRQASFIAAALAQFVSDKTQRDVLDNGDLPGFVELLGSGFAVEYLSRKNPFGDIKSDGTVKTALENLQLGEAAKRDVGTGNNQLPDMSAFGMSRNGQTAWDILPNGMIRQAGTVTLTPVGSFNAQVLGGVTYYTHYYRVNFPRQFPNAQIATLATLASYSYSTQATMAGKSLATHRDTDSGTDVSRTRFTVAYTTPNLGETPTLHFEAIGY